MKNIITFTAFLCFMAFMVVVMVEWASGCGETYTDAKGQQHQYQCWIVK